LIINSRTVGEVKLPTGKRGDKKGGTKNRSNGEKTKKTTQLTNPVLSKTRVENVKMGFLTKGVRTSCVFWEWGVGRKGGGYSSKT